MTRRWCALLFSMSVLTPLPVAAQLPAADHVRLFLDCQRFDCDFDFYRREVPFVDFVRDRQVADVHVLVTPRETGGGGQEFTLSFIGLQRFQGLERQLRVSSTQTNTEDEERRLVLRTLKMGLMPYVAETAAAPRIEIVHDAGDLPTQQTTAAEDPWDFWVFEIELGGSVSGEERQRGYSINGSVSANRVTEALKIGLEVEGDREREEFELTDSTLIDLTHSLEVDGLIAVSLGDHWGAGAGAEVRSSTFSNEKIAVQFGPTIEFNVFPYQVSATRALTLRYTIGPRIIRYEEETIFDRTRETIFGHQLNANLSFVQPWGDAGFELAGATFLDDFSKHRLEVGGEIEFRIFRGFSMEIEGRVERTKDQVNLPKAGASDDEILLQRRELGTNYEYWGSLGFSFQFGSIFNNVVNPRFDQF
jgi:hypothetical protein